MCKIASNNITIFKTIHKIVWRLSRILSIYNTTNKKTTPLCVDCDDTKYMGGGGIRITNLDNKCVVAPLVHLFCLNVLFIFASAIAGGEKKTDAAHPRFWSSALTDDTHPTENASHPDCMTARKGGGGEGAPST